MKKLMTLFLMCFLFSSCKKTKEKIAYDLVIEAMTNGQWAITDFKLNGSDITADFSTYKFQYYSNKTVDAIKNGVKDRTGNWDANASAMTTSANFSGAIYPISLINGIWNITNNSWTFVEASQTNGSETKTMRLDKL